MLAAKMRFDREVLPVVEFVDQGGTRRAGLQSQRIAAEIDLFRSVGVARNQELVAERRERVIRVQLERQSFCGREVCVGHGGTSTRTGKIVTKSSFRRKPDRRLSRRCGE